MAPRRSTARPANFASRRSDQNRITSQNHKTSRTMKAIFRGLTFSFSGYFGEGWEHENMARWITYHGGQYEREVSDDTTHLICTHEDFKNKTTQVRKAWALGSRCDIVVKDWLEDCLASTPSKKRRRAEKGYSLSRVLRRLDQTLEDKERYRASFESGVRAGQELVDNLLHHVYYDQTGFEYKVVCTRINEAGRVKSEKYTIYLFESNAKPCTYMVGAKLTSPGRHASYWRTECHPKPFHKAFQDFEKFFKDTTGIEWDQRLDRIPDDPQKFRYAAPLLGRPVGALPSGKHHPSLQVKKKATSDETEGLIYDTDSDLHDDYDSDTALDKPRRQRSVSIAVSSGSS